MFPSFRSSRQWMVRSILHITILFLVVPAIPFTVQGQWSADPRINTPVCTASGDQLSPQAVTDGHHGVILAWLDFRNGNADIYAQRLNMAGLAQWMENGVAICAEADAQVDLKMISDGSGGAIIAWRDTGSSNVTIGCQKVNAAGALEWNASGVVICASPGTKGSPDLVSDAAGGAIITWSDNRNGNFDIYAQRIDASGSVQWLNNGVTICNAAGAQTTPQLAGNRMGGAVITWADTRSRNSDIYAQSIDASGVVQWSPENGVVVCSNSSTQPLPKIIDDGAKEGSIICWQDMRPGIYAQRLGPDGRRLWKENGVPACIFSNERMWHYSQQIVSDGSGGAIISWRLHYLVKLSLYVQHIDHAGAIRWRKDGVLIQETDNFHDFTYHLTALGGGCVSLTYALESDTHIMENPGAIKAMKINAKGGYAADNSIGWPQFLNYHFGAVLPVQFTVSDGFGGMIVAWSETRSGESSHIYAQNVDSLFRLGSVPTIVDVAGLPREFALGQNYPNPFNPSTVIPYALPAASAHVKLEVFNTLGERVAVVVEGLQEAGYKTAEFNASGLPTGVYFYRLQAGPFVDTKKFLFLK